MKQLILGDYLEILRKENITLYKEGKQTYTFKPGSHRIAVKAVDNEGLETFEVFRVKINGEIIVE